MAREMQSIADKADENAKTQQKDLETLKIDVSGKIEDVNLNYHEMEKENKRLIKNSLQARQTANSNTSDIIDLKRKVESHGLKINAANSYGNGGSWLSRSDEGAHPILKKDKTNHWSKYINSDADAAAAADAAVDADADTDTDTDTDADVDAGATSKSNNIWEKDIRVNSDDSVNTALMSSIDEFQLLF